MMSAARTFGNRQHDHEHTLLAHVDAVFEDNFADDSAAIIVHDTTNLDAADFARAILVELDDIAGITDKDIVARNTALSFSDLGIVDKHVEFTVVWQIVLWIDGVDDADVIVVVAMTTQVEWADASQVCLAVLNDFPALAHQAVDGAHDVLFVTRDRVTTEDDDVAVFDLDVFVRASCHTVQNSAELTLATGTNDGDFAVRQLDDVFHFDDGIFGYFDSASSQRDLEVLNHTEAGKCDLATMLLGFVKNQLHTM